MSYIYIGFAVERSYVVINHALDVLCGSCTECAFCVSPIVHTKVELEWSGTFQFELLVVRQRVCDGFRILTRNCQVVDVDGNIFVVVVKSSHPYVCFSFAREESHFA